MKKKDMTMKKTETIVTSSRPKEFKKAIARLNRKALRLGVDPIEFTFVKKETRDLTHVLTRSFEGEKETESKMYLVDVWVWEVTHLDVVQNGWSLCAKLSRQEDGSVFVDTLARPEGFREADWKESDPSACEHCNTNRRRLNGFVVHHVDRGFLQVGSTCLKELVGGDTASELAFASMVFFTIKAFEEDWMEGGGGGARIVNGIELEVAVAVALQIQAEDGEWTRTVRSQYDERHIEVMGTNLKAKEILNKKDPRIVKVSVVDFIPEATRIVDQIRDMDADEGNEFQETMIALFDNRMIPSDRSGLACYAPQFLKDVQARKEREAMKGKSNFVGDVKERLRDIPVKVDNYREYTSNYDDSLVCVITFRDADLNLYVWFTSCRGVEVGDEFLLTGTVKDHNDRDGEKQTILSRCIMKEK